MTAGTSPAPFQSLKVIGAQPRSFRRMTMNRIVALFVLTFLVASVAVVPRGQDLTGASLKTSAAPRDERIAREAEAMRAQLVAQRRELHMHPELSNREE